MSRERPPETRAGITKAFTIPYKDEETQENKTLKFWITANAYEDGRLCEIFVKGDKIGGLLGGVLDTVAIMISLALQNGVASYLLTSQLRYHKFGPAYNLRKDLEFHTCTSMFDLIAQWLDREFPEGRWVKMAKKE